MLDLGCGSGWCAIAAKQKVGAAGEVVAVDISSELIARARENVWRAGLPADSIQFALSDILASYHLRAC